MPDFCMWAAGWDYVIYQGEVSAQDFLAFYIKANRVLAVAGMNRDREMAAIEELMRLDRMPVPALLRNGPTNFLELLKDVSETDTSNRGAIAHHQHGDAAMAWR